MKKSASQVLIIDDNEDILFMLKAMLQYNGYQVTVKDNAEGLEEIAEQLMPDLVIMDMLLSGTDGTEVCRLFKNNSEIKHIPVMMISALPQAAERCLAAGADYFAGKPFEMNQFLETVAIAIAGKSTA